MSRPQETQAFNTASGQNAAEFQNAQNSYAATNQAIGDYSGELSKYAAANPYVAGGEYQTNVGRGLADTADSSARAAGGALQAEALRAGENPNAATAATETMQQQNERALAGQEAGAESSRIGSEAEYNKGVLGASAVPIQAEESLYGTTLGGAGSDLKTEQAAGETPGFGDMLLQSLISAGGQVGAGFAKGCWIAAELYGGWFDPRTILLRSWLFGPYANTRQGWVATRFYTRYGKRLAEIIKTRPYLRRVVKMIFDHWLKKATAWKVA